MSYDGKYFDTSILISDAPCGAGKTTAQTRHGTAMAHQGRRIMLVQPTKKLIRQTAAGLEAEGCPRVTAICGADADNEGEGRFSSDVVGAIMEHLRREPQGGEVLLMTHAAHQRLPWVQNRAGWDLVYDEAPAAQWCEAVNVPDTHAILTELIDTEAFNPEYLRVEAREHARLRAIAKNRNGDEFFGRLAPIANVLLSPHWDCFVDAEQFANVVDAHGSRRQLIFHATINPGLFRGYRSVTILAADAGETALCHVLAGKVAFREARQFDKHLRYTTHPNGELLTIEYLSEQDWSKNFRDKKAEDGKPFLEHAVERIKGRVGDRHFAWMGNKRCVST